MGVGQEDGILRSLGLADLTRLSGQQAPGRDPPVSASPDLTFYHVPACPAFKIKF